MDRQQPEYSPDENPRMYTMLTDVPSVINNEIPHEQQIVYYNPPMNYQTGNIPQPYLYPQQLANSQIINQYLAASVAAQHHQQQHTSSSINMLNTLAQPPMIHSNTNQQQVLLLSHQPPVNVSAPSYSSMTNPTGASTPIAAPTKRGRNDTSGASESNVQIRPQYPQSTRIFNPSNTPNKRLRGINQQTNQDTFSNRYGQNQLRQPIQNPNTTMEPISSNDNQQQPSIAACRFATSRFPFSPFSVIFSQEVREKLVIDDLMKHALDILNFELKTVAHRRGRSYDNEHRILIFVENSESFAFLYDSGNWPTILANCQFTIKSPSIPPQLALVLPIVSLQTDWDDFVQELKDKYPGVANVIRLKNKAQQPVRAVKLEFLSSSLRNEILTEGEISIMHMKLRVVEYYSQANVLICSNCYGIGHFRKSCPQKDESTCKTCGEKCTSIQDHQCSGVLKCIHCSGPHVSNDAKCRVVKDYRAALTRNLLANPVSNNMEGASSRPAPINIPSTGSTIVRQPYATVSQMMPSNSNEILFKKLDDIVAKVEEESATTRRALDEVREEMRNRYEETKQQVDMLENKVKNMEKKFEDLSMRMFTVMLNICTSLLDPKGSQSPNWKSYWQEQIKTLIEFRSTTLTPI